MAKNILAVSCSGPTEELGFCKIATSGPVADTFSESTGRLSALVPCIPLPDRISPFLPFLEEVGGPFQCP